METIKHLNFFITLFPLSLIVFTLAIGVILLNQHFQKNMLLQKLEREALKNLHKNELLGVCILVQEEERKRISQDIHDELGSVLSIMRMNIRMLEDKSEGLEQSDILLGLENIRQLTEISLDSVRSITHRLMPSQLEQFGLIKTLQTVVYKINDAGALNIQLTTLSYMQMLSWPIDLGLYRITLELINNTIKHAEAKNIVIIFDCDNEVVTCTYSDDGKGMPTNYEGKGLGLKGILGRASSLGGNVKFGNSDIKYGFNASINIPIGNTG